jgi:hypothetical protein
MRRTLIMQEETDFLLMTDCKNFVINVLGKEQWLTVYRFERTEFEHISYYCALIPNKELEECLSSADWDLTVGEGMPGCNVSGFGDKKIVQYQRFGTSSEVEPLVIAREFYGIRKDYVELSEEFRHYHNLYHDRTNDAFIKIKDSGEEEEIAVIKDNTVLIKVKAIRQFLGMKDMSLALYFTIDRHTVEPLEDLGVSEETHEVENGEFKYYFITREWKFSDDFKTHSRLMGKKIIPGYSVENSGIWPYDSEKEHEEFIIGKDKNGESVTYSCNYDELANYFGANPHAPHYLTPVFFSREVLRKYLNQPEKYTVEDGYLRCGSLWGVQIDNNHDDLISVFLGDLGRDMPYVEQTYWRSYNVVAEEEISEVNFKRSFLAEFTDPAKVDLILKGKYRLLQERWFSNYGWHLYERLKEGDQHYFNTLRIPITDDQAEFDKQILALAKLFIDSISIRDLQEYTGETEDKVLPLLEQFLQKKKINGYEPHLLLLRKLYEIRSSGVGHRKGKNYIKIARYFGLTSKNTVSILEDIMKQLISFLDFLNNNCLPKE